MSNLGDGQHRDGALRERLKTCGRAVLGGVSGAAISIPLSIQTVHHDELILPCLILGIAVYAVVAMFAVRRDKPTVMFRVWCQLVIIPACVLFGFNGNLSRLYAGILIGTAIGLVTLRLQPPVIGIILGYLLACALMATPYTEVTRAVLDYAVTHKTTDTLAIVGITIYAVGVYLTMTPRRVS